MFRLALVVPPAPVQVSLNSALLFRAALASDPEILLLPAHAPLAVQEVTFAVLQVRVTAPPRSVESAEEFRVTVGAGAGLGLGAGAPPSPPPQPHATSESRQPEMAAERMGRRGESMGRLPESCYAGFLGPVSVDTK